VRCDPHTFLYHTAVYQGPNPFTFGDLALDEAFTDREQEVAEIAADMKNGQNVVLFAPRRYGKSSLVLRAAQEAVAGGVLVGYCDLMRTPTKERFAAALAKTIWEDIAPPGAQIAERATSLFRGLRLRPSMEIDADTGSLRFSFDAVRRRRSGDIDDTIERLLELPQDLANERQRRVVLVLDEFQEVVKLDRSFPNLMRAVFQTQPEVGHVYLGSKRHVLDAIFNDRNEPFWRSAKRLEIGTIPTDKFRPFVRRRFEDTDKGITDRSLDRLLEATGGHPYGTQELAYFVWELVSAGHSALETHVDTALEKVLRSEHNHFTRIWDDATEHERLLLLALSEEPGPVYSGEYQGRHDLRSSSHVQRALTALIKEEVVGRNEQGDYLIVEPFLAEWVRRGQSVAPVLQELRAPQDTVET
jgi:AAA+ ATPase superfamily predicted ATPase